MNLRLSDAPTNLQRAARHGGCSIQRSVCVSWNSLRSGATSILFFCVPPGRRDAARFGVSVHHSH